MAAQLPPPPGVAWQTVAHGGVWLVGSRGRGSRWIGDWPAHGAVRSRIRLIRTFLFFPFPFVLIPLGIGRHIGSLQVSCHSLPTRSMFPVAKIGESFSVLYSGLVTG